MPIFPTWLLMAMATGMLLIGCSNAGPFSSEAMRLKAMQSIQEMDLAEGVHDEVELWLDNNGNRQRFVVSVWVADKQIGILHKDTLQPKMNYRGTFFFLHNVDASHLSTDYYGRDVIYIPGFRPSPVIREQISPKVFLVFHDLG